MVTWTLSVARATPTPTRTSARGAGERAIMRGIALPLQDPLPSMSAIAVVEEATTPETTRTMCQEEYTGKVANLVEKEAGAKEAEARRTLGATSAARSTTAAPSGGKVGLRATQKEDKELKEDMEEAREDSAAKVVITARAGEVEVERLGQDRDR